MTLLNLPAPYRVEWFPAESSAAAAAAGGSTHHMVVLTDGSRLILPLTPLPGGDKAVALLMSNQTDFTVERKIVERMIDPVRIAAPDAVVGIPTLGLTYARPVAQAIGLHDFVALGHSRKFWYDDALSEAVISSTSPDQSKRVYLDPALLERVRGRRVVVVDDVLNTGATMASAVNLLHKAQAKVVAIVVVLTEGWDWHRKLAGIDPGIPALVHALGHIPLFARSATGWLPIPATTAGARPA
jgi:adenine/guanine phosphoribosyltransferase-like PRPP-binding protein